MAVPVLASCGKASSPTSAATPPSPPDTVGYTEFHWSTDHCEDGQPWIAELTSGIKVDTIEVHRPDVIYCGVTNQATYAYSFDKRLPLTVHLRLKDPIVVNGVWTDLDMQWTYPRQDTTHCDAFPVTVCTCVPHDFQCFQTRVIGGAQWPPSLWCASTP